MRSFLTVYRTGGVAKAATALHLSQPAVSHHLRAIEKITRRPMFVRSGRGIAPTEAAHALAAVIADHIDSIDNALDVMQAGSTGGLGPAYIGGPADQLDGYVLPRLAPLIDRDMVVHCRTDLSNVLVEGLLTDELDIAIVTKIEGAPTKRLHVVHCYDEEFVLVGRSGQPAFDPLSSHRRFVGYSEAMPMARRYFRECWGSTPPTPAVTVPDVRAVVSTVASSSLLSVVPRYLAQRAIDGGSLEVLHQPSVPVVNPIYVASRRGREHLPHISALVEHLRSR